jgi:hypothetical protein
VLALRRCGPGTARRGGLLCLVQMASAGHATPTAPTRNDAGALSANKTPASRPLNYDAARATASISLKDLTDTWQAQITYLQEATVSGNLKEQGARLQIRAHVLKGMRVLQTLLGQSNTVHRSQIIPGCPNRPDTEGGLVSVPIYSSLVTWHACEAACLRSPCRFWVRLAVMVRALCWSISASYSRDPGAANFCTRV